MTNATIFYIIGLVLGAILGYSFRRLIEPTHTIMVVVKSKENADDEQREADI